MVAMEGKVNIPLVDREQIARALAKQAMSYPAGAIAYYRDLLDRINLPEDWAMSVTDMWKGDALADARKLVKWTISKGVNTADPNYTTVGSLLAAFLEDQGLEDKRCTVGIIYNYKLYRDEEILSQLIARYQVPTTTVAAPGEARQPSAEMRLDILPD